MKCTSTTVLLALIYASVVISSNILVFVPSPWKSHITSFQPLFLELAYRGHNVTVVSKFTVKNPPPNYRQVTIDYDFDFDSYSAMSERYENLFLLEEIYIRNVIAMDITKHYSSSSDVQAFIKEDKSTFDLVIVESFFQECTVAIGHKYGAPVISFIPVAPWVSPSRWAANPSDFSYIKDFALNSGKIMNFWTRLTNTCIGLYSMLIEPITYLPQMEKLMNEYYQYSGYENRPSMSEMLKNISLSLIDSDVMILNPRPYVSNFIEVPGIHLQRGQKMNEKLQSFMDKAISGVVYFNFGSLLNVTNIPKPSMKVLVNVLGRLEQKIVFKWINNDTRGFPDNFYVDDWFPQLEILNHPNCKLFITHGRVHGLMETIDAGVPIIGFPFFGDQHQNLRISRDNGFAIISDIYKITEENFEKDVNSMLTDKKFTNNAKRMSSIFHDRPMSALDTAVYWIEYVIRHEGAHHLRSAAVALPWYQYYLIDVISFIILTTLSSVLIVYFLIKLIWNFFLNLLLKPKKVKSS